MPSHKHRRTTSSSSLPPPNLQSASPSRHSFATNTTTINIQIPSLHDSILLTTRLYVPPPPICKKAAVIAHPYAPLGGSLHDHVVQGMAESLVAAGWIVAVFNFRGATHSKGRTTWTGRAETADFITVARWLVAFASSLPTVTASTAITKDEEQEVLELVLGGYSYGALIAASCDSSLSSTMTETGTEAEARKMGRTWMETHGDRATTRRISYSSPTRSLAVEPGSPSMVLATSPPYASLTPAVVIVNISHLLISPPLPPISSALLLGRTTAVMPPASSRSVLAIWGTEDGFTAVKKYRRWKDVMCRDGINVEGVEVDGAGHFWWEQGAEERLTEVVVKWARRISG